MNRGGYLALIFVALAGLASPVAAQTFVNLDFQAANLAENTTAALFPGWSFSPDNGFAATEPHLSSGPQRFLRTNGGDYSAVMAAGDWGDGLTPPFFTAVSMWQIAVVPSSAKSIRLEASWSPFSNPDPAGMSDRIWSLSLDGAQISMNHLGGGIWGGNIPNYANQLRTLTITAHDEYYSLDFGGYPFVEFDDIQFSSQPVPESSTFCLAAISFLGLARYRRR